MKKLIGPFAKVGGALFAVGVFVIIVSLSYSALGRIFPGRLFDQAAGMLLFDAAAIVWFLTFIGNSESTSQYVFSGIGFGLGVVGSLFLIGIEVGISSGMLVATTMIKPLTYIFIFAAACHLLLTYFFHGSAPELAAKISLGVEKARVQDEGMRQAEISLKQNMSELGEVISARLVEEVLHDLNMRPRQIIDSRLLPVDDSLHAASNGYPLQVHPLREKVPSFFEDPRGWFQKRFARSPSNSQVTETEMEPAWIPGPNGERLRVYCLVCKQENKPWRTPEACSHVLNTTAAPMQGYAMDVASVSIPGGTADANTVTEPASNKPTESAEPSKGVE